MQDGEAAGTPENAGISLNDATSRIEALMGPIGEPEKGDDQGEALKGQDEDLEEIVDEGDEDNATGDLEPEEDDDALEDDGAEEGDEEGDLEDVYTVKVNGEEVEVTLGELQAGYSRTQDYTAKTMDLAEQRKGLEAMTAEVQTERSQYAEMLPLLAAQLEAQVGQEPDWDTLFDRDPIQASRQKYEWDKHQDALRERQGAIQAEFQRVTQANAAEAERAKQLLIQQEVAKLPEVIPEWADQTVMEGEVADLRLWAKGAGIPDDVMENIESSAVVAALRKAMFYDKGQKRVARKRTKPSKNMKPGSTTSNRKRAVSDVTRGKQRLAKTGRLEDAAGVIENLL